MFRIEFSANSPENARFHLCRMHVILRNFYSAIDCLGNVMYSITEQGNVFPENKNIIRRYLIWQADPVRMYLAQKKRKN